MVGGPGLDARLFTDLSTLTTDALVTPADHVYVRTAAPRGLTPDPATWAIALGPPPDPPARACAPPRSPPRRSRWAPHVMECAGNSNPQNFGLMSAVEWDGVPARRGCWRGCRARPAPPACWSPASTTTARARGTSQPGASWVLPLDAIDRLGAVPGRAHERPAARRRPRRAGAAGGARLVRVRVDQVGAPGSSGSAPTPRPRRRCASSPAARIRTACRRWRATTRPRPSTPPRCRCGSSSAGSTAASNTAWSASSGAARSPWTVCSSASGPAIRARRSTICPAPRTHHTWSLWTYRWRPAEPGYYDIALRVADPSVRTRRLDLSFYIRRVRIDEV